MINVKEAVTAAMSFMTDLYNARELANLSLEEVELSDDGEYWSITLGYTRPVTSLQPHNPAATLQSYLNQQKIEQVYKVVSVRNQDGQVTSMKMRAPIAA